MIQLDIDKVRLNDEKYVLNVINAIMIQKLIEGVGQKYDKCFNYYEGNEPQTHFDTEYDYKCKVVNLTKPIVDIATKTFIGELPDITTSGKKAEKEKISVFNQKLYNRQFDDHIYETMHYSSKCGTGFLAIYNKIGDTFPRFRELNPRFADCVYDCTLAKEHIMSYNIVQINDATNPTNIAMSKYVIYVYTKDRIYAFESPMTYTAQTTTPDAEKEIIIKPYFAWTMNGVGAYYVEHGFGDIPIVEFPNNAEYKGDAECVFDLIALYNEVLNNRCKNLYDVVNYILMIKNVRLGDEEETKKVITMLKQHHILPVEGDNVDAKFLSNPLDQAQLQKLADSIKDLIHLICRVPDLSGIDFSQNASDPIIKIKTKPLLDLCSDKEKKCNEPYLRVLRMILSWCKVNNPSEYGTYDFDLDIIRLVYSHALPSNDSDMVTMITNLASSKMANPEVLLQPLSFIPSVSDYIKGMEKWNEKVDKMKKENENKNVNGFNETNLERQNAKPLSKNQMDNKKNFDLGNAQKLSENKVE